MTCALFTHRRNSDRKFSLSFFYWFVFKLAFRNSQRNHAFLVIYPLLSAIGWIFSLAKRRHKYLDPFWKRFPAKENFGCWGGGGAFEKMPSSPSIIHCIVNLQKRF